MVCFPLTYHLGGDFDHGKIMRPVFFPLRTKLASDIFPVTPSIATPSRGRQRGGDFGAGARRGARKSMQRVF